MPSNGDDPRFKTGFEELDVEHALEIGLMEELQTALESGEAWEKVEPLIERMAAFLKGHFLSEQVLMRLHNYPDYQSHVIDHEHALDGLTQLGQLAQARDAKGSAACLSALKDWLIHHIVGKDLELGRFLAGRTLPSA